jgi:hypothetical protein
MKFEALSTENVDCGLQGCNTVENRMYHHSFEGTKNPLDGRDTFSQNADNHLQDYMALQPKRQRFTVTHPSYQNPFT